MDILITLILNSIAVFVAGSIIPGVRLYDFMTAVVVAVVLGFINAIIRPIVFVLTLPINIITMGLFSFVIIGSLTLLVSYIVPGFEVDGFWWALLFAFVLAIFNSFLFSLTKRH
ncbi:MAG: phage holin family protein [Chlamydiota bacterium]|nr:phage holin family protein [Chlamydiota bacterium]